MEFVHATVYQKIQNIWDLEKDFMKHLKSTELKILINQAFSSSPVHFYITVNGVYEFHRRLELGVSEFINQKELFQQYTDTFGRNKNFIFGCFGENREFDFDSIIWELEGIGTENAILKNN